MTQRRFPPPWSVEACRIIALSQRIMELNTGNGIVGVRLSEFVMTRLASRASTSGRGLLTFIQPLRGSSRHLRAGSRIISLVLALAANIAKLPELLKC